MTVNPYITLATSDYNPNVDPITGTIKKFKVLLDQYAVGKQKSEQVRRTIDGGLDVSRGGVYDVHSYLIKVPQAVNDSSWGTKDDLEMFFSLNDPSGTPSDRITLVDNEGNSHTCVMTGDYVPQAQAVVIEGIWAYFIVQCTFEIIP